MWFFGKIEIKNWSQGISVCRSSRQITNILWITNCSFHVFVWHALLFYYYFLHTWFIRCLYFESIVRCYIKNFTSFSPPKENLPSEHCIHIWRQLEYSQFFPVGFCFLLYSHFIRAIHLWLIEPGQLCTKKSGIRMLENRRSLKVQNMQKTILSSKNLKEFKCHSNWGAEKESSTIFKGF